MPIARLSGYALQVKHSLNTKPHSHCHLFCIKTHMCAIVLAGRSMPIEEYPVKCYGNVLDLSKLFFGQPLHHFDYISSVMKLCKRRFFNQEVVVGGADDATTATTLQIWKSQRRYIGEGREGFSAKNSLRFLLVVQHICLQFHCQNDCDARNSLISPTRNIRH